MALTFIGWRRSFLAGVCRAQAQHAGGEVLGINVSVSLNQGDCLPAAEFLGDVALRGDAAGWAELAWAGLQRCCGSGAKPMPV